MQILTKNIIQHLFSQDNFIGNSEENNSLRGEFSSLLRQLFGGKEKTNINLNNLLDDREIKGLSNVEHNIGKSSKKLVSRDSVGKSDNAKSIDSPDDFPALQMFFSLLEEKAEKILKILDAGITTDTGFQKVKSGESELVIPVSFDEKIISGNKKTPSNKQNYLVISFPNPDGSEKVDATSEPVIALLTEKTTVSHLLTQVDQAGSGINVDSRNNQKTAGIKSTGITKETSLKTSRSEYVQHAKIFRKTDHSFIKVDSEQDVTPNLTKQHINSGSRESISTPTTRELLLNADSKSLLKNQHQFRVPDTIHSDFERSQIKPAFVGNKISKTHLTPESQPVKSGNYVLIHLKGNLPQDSGASLKTRLSGLLQKMNGTLLVKESPEQKANYSPRTAGGKTTEQPRINQPVLAGKKAEGEFLRGDVTSQSKTIKVSRENIANRHQINTQSAKNSESSEAGKVLPTRSSNGKPAVSENQVKQTYDGNKTGITSGTYSKTQVKNLRHLDISATQNGLSAQNLHKVGEKSLGRMDKKYSKVTPEEPARYTTTPESESLSDKQGITDNLNEISLKGGAGSENAKKIENSLELGFGLSGHQSANQILGGASQTESRVPVIQQVIEKLQSMTQQLKANLVTHNAQNINAQISLKPAHLGTVLLSLRFSENMLRGTILTSTHEAKHSIEKQMPIIREAVQHQNVSLQDIKVEVRTDINRDQRQSFADQFSREQSGSEHRRNDSAFSRSATSGFSPPHEETNSAVTRGTTQLSPGRIEYYA